MSGVACASVASEVIASFGEEGSAVTVPFEAGASVINSTLFPTSLFFLLLREMEAVTDYWSVQSISRNTHSNRQVLAVRDFIYFF